MRNIFISFFFGFGALIVVGVYSLGIFGAGTKEVVTVTATPSPFVPYATAAPTLSPTPQATALPGRVVHSAPFTAQAPFGDWADPRQQGA
ncbi:MAG: hypothetical protein AAB608_00765, partial [Patescibacteria group bacterium]